MDSEIRPIRTDADYRDALARVDVLVNARPGTPEGDELEVLSTLIEVYETKHFPIDMPSAVDAIRFRMEQQGLSKRDLEPHIGSRSKVSEVLSGKRPLTLQMIRSLHFHLGIPAEVLLQKPGADLPESPAGLDWNRFPIRAMAGLGWIPDQRESKEHAEEIMRDFINRAGGFDALPQPLFRKTANARQNTKSCPYALKAWCWRLLALARGNPPEAEYEAGLVTLDFCRRVARLSWSEHGPRLAREFLRNHGIQLIHLPHLPHTYLDGAVLQPAGSAPVIGLTLRYDRLDYFWFSLCHELAHIALHLQGSDAAGFVDDLSIEGFGRKLSRQEKEADEWAQDALIPPEEWEESGILRSPDIAAVTRLAHRLEIHPAIVAGRVRREKRNYRLLTHFVGVGEATRALAC
ncbi:MAG: transcriptional regulator [Acidobacteria bacterium]|nr:transcriptional regulator [Acidobacteriota bacterium]